MVKTTFNSTAFAELLNRAKGTRSINEYANQCGISAAHISRHLRELIDVSPSPTTIQKLTSVAHHGVTYAEMMKVCGYIAEDYSKTDMTVIIEALKKEIDKATEEMKATMTPGSIGKCQGLLRALEIVNEITE